MARYIVIHHPKYPKADNLDPFIYAARDLMRSLGPDFQWLNSWWVANREKLFCEWEAPSEEALRAKLKKACRLWPIDTVYEVFWNDPQWYLDN